MQDEEDFAKMNDIRFIIGLGSGEHEYTVNGVRYIVTSKFIPLDFKNFKDTLADAIEKYINNDLAEWTDEENCSKIDAECVSTAGEEA